jgi:hypothetical protein
VNALVGCEDAFLQFFGHLYLNFFGPMTNEKHAGFNHFQLMGFFNF